MEKENGAPFKKAGFICGSFFFLVCLALLLIKFSFCVFFYMPRNSIFQIFTVVLWMLVLHFFFSRQT